MSANPSSPQTLETSPGEPNTDQRISTFSPATVSRMLVVIAAIFIAVYILVPFLMASTWTKDMRAYLARSNATAGRYDRAIGYYERLLQTNPTNVSYQAELGNALYSVQRYDDSIATYQIAQKMVNEQREALAGKDDNERRELPNFTNMIGLAYFKKGDLKAAEENLRAALKNNRLDALANFTLGEVMLKQNRLREAADYFKVVVDHPAYKAKVVEYYREIETKLFSNI